MTLRENALRIFANLIGAGSMVKADTPPDQTAATQQSNQLPISWLTETYAPGLPIQPLASSGDALIPREIDYPVSVNASLQPRTAYGLMPFAALKEAYETVAEVRLPVSTLLREMMIFRPHLVDKDGGEIYDHDFEWLCHSPDRVQTFDVWMTRFLKSALIFDAGAFFYEYDKGNLNAVRYIDGSTLFVMVDEHGQVPRPNDRSSDPAVIAKYNKKVNEWKAKGKAIPKTTPAYAQIIKGTPFGWYDTNQIWYKPRSRRFDAPYGETAIEQAWAWIMLVANITGFELAHYREGNVPEGLFTTPEGWSLERIASFEKAFNDRLSVGATERRRGRFLPFGSVYQQTKVADFPQTLYDQALNTISLFFGVPPSEYGKVPGAGLGGKGFEEAMQSSLFRMGLLPMKIYVEGAMNEVLNRAGVDDAWFHLGFPTEEMTPDKHKQSIIDLVSNGLITFNNALSQLGQDQIEGGDVHILIKNGQVQIIEEVLKDPSLMRPASPFMMPGQQPAAGQKNAPMDGSDMKDSPTDTEPTRKEKQTKDDLKIAEKLLKDRSLDLYNRFTSIPDSVKLHGDVLPKHPKDPKNRFFAPKGKIDNAEAVRLIAELGGDAEQVDIEMFRNEIDEALVRGVVTNDEEYLEAGAAILERMLKGGSGSGNFGHSGRVGERGGSGGGGMLGGGGGTGLDTLLSNSPWEQFPVGSPERTQAMKNYLSQLKTVKTNLKNLNQNAQFFGDATGDFK